MHPFNRFGTGLLMVVMASTAMSMAQPGRKSLLDSDPDVIYLEHVFEKPLELSVTQEAPVFSDKNAARKLGALKANQKVKLEAITDKAYRVRGQGLHDGISGWVGPKAFTSPDPDFVVHLKQLYDRQMKVKELIEAKELAIGMTPKEVQTVLGKPTKTTMRKTVKGESGQWEYVEYEEIRHYADRVDPITGLIYRQLVSVTREEKERTVVEFEDGYVSALEESKNRKARRSVTVVLPQMSCHW